MQLVLLLARRSLTRGHVWAAVLVVGSILGLRVAWNIATHVGPPDVYQKDFVQEYLLSRALLDRLDLYAPRGTLASHYGLPEIPLSYLPTPHPPPMAIVFLPAALTDYPRSASVWLGIEVGLLATAMWLLLRSVRAHLPPAAVIALTLSLLPLYPFRSDLSEGQLMVLLLVLLTGAWLALRSNRPVLAGALVGLAVLVKFVPWPLLLLFAVRREWRALAAGLLSIALGYLVTLIAVGPTTILHYFTQALPANNYDDAIRMSNFSVWSIGARLFEGIGTPDKPGGVTGAALVYSPVLARMVTPVIPSLVLMAGLVWAGRRVALDRAFGVMVAVSILLSPIVWQNYFLLAALPAAEVIASMVRTSAVRMWAALCVVSLVLLSVPWGWWWSVAHFLVGESPTRQETWTMLSAPASLVTLGPILALGLFCWGAAVYRAAESTRLEAAQVGAPGSVHANPAAAAIPATPLRPAGEEFGA
jgi:hypothetical protein